MAPIIRGWINMDGKRFVLAQRHALTCSRNTAISGIPHWSGLHVQVGQDVLAAGVPEDQISGFTSVLDIGTATMSWRYTWSPPSGPAIDIEYSMFLHKLYVNQAAVRVKLTATKPVNATIIDVMNGDAAVRTDFADKAYEDSSPTIWTGVRPSYINNVTAYIYSTLQADDSRISDSTGDPRNRPSTGTHGEEPLRRSRPKGACPGSA